MAALWLSRAKVIDRDDQIGRVMAVMMTSAGPSICRFRTPKGCSSSGRRHHSSSRRRRRYEAAGLDRRTRRNHAACMDWRWWRFRRSRAGWMRTAVPRGRAGCGPGLTVAGVSPIPVATFLAYEDRVLGSPFAFLARQAMWNNPSPIPVSSRHRPHRVSPKRISGWIHGATWVLYVALLVRYWRRLPIGEVLFCAGVLLISTQQESFQGIYRYMVPADSAHAGDCARPGRRPATA
jgi:hypothetical protein